MTASEKALKYLKPRTHRVVAISRDRREGRTFRLEGADVHLITVQTAKIAELVLKWPFWLGRAPLNRARDVP